MTNLTDLTLQQLRASTKAQIIASIRDYLTANYTRRQLIQFLRDRETEWDEPIRTYRTDGQIESQIEVERDEETGEIVSSKSITWSYYSTGEVNVILIIVYDATGIEIKRKRIKHFKDGRQPEVN